MEFLGRLSSATLCSGGVSPARGAARVGDGAGAGPCSQAVSPERDRRPCHPGTPCQAGLVLPIPSQPAPAVLGKRRQPVSNPKADYGVAESSRRGASVPVPAGDPPPKQLPASPVCVHVCVLASPRARAASPRPGRPRRLPLGEGPVPSSRLKSSFSFHFFPVRLASHPQTLRVFSQCLHVQNLPRLRILCSGGMSCVCEGEKRTVGTGRRRSWRGARTGRGETEDVL